MKGIKLKVHFIAGNGIERSEYIESNLKKWPLHSGLTTWDLQGYYLNTDGRRARRARIELSYRNCHKQTENCSPLHCEQKISSCVDKRNTSMEHWLIDTDEEILKYWEKKRVPVQLPPTQIPHRLSWDRKRICSAEGWLLTVWVDTWSIHVYWTNYMNVLITYVGQYQKK
jgi:hypothetical protein